MTSIKIEGGTTQLNATNWEYRYTQKDGEHVIIFTASRRPRIGDTIVNGALVDAVLPQSNQDKSQWIPQHYDEWPDYQ